MWSKSLALLPLLLLLPLSVWYAFMALLHCFDNILFASSYSCGMACAIAHGTFPPFAFWYHHIATDLLCLEDLYRYCFSCRQ